MCGDFYLGSHFFYGVYCKMDQARSDSVNVWKMIRGLGCVIVEPPGKVVVLTDHVAKVSHILIGVDCEIRPHVFTLPEPGTPRRI